MERELPSWYPRLALAMIPVTILAAAVFGHDDRSWALASLAMGTFVFVLMVALWSAPSSLIGVAVSLALALGSASIVGFGLWGLAQLPTPAEDEPPASTAPVSTVSPSTTGP